MKGQFLKIVACVILLISNHSQVMAQGTLDKLKFEEAEQNFINKRYIHSVIALEELESKGLKNPTVLHLKILATSKIQDDKFLDDIRIVQFKKDVEFYLKNYDIEGLEEKYKDIYEVSKTLSQNRWDEARYCAIQGDNQYKSKEHEKALNWYLKAEKYGYINDKLFHRIGHMYNFGQGTERNAKKAFQYNLKAAEMGNSSAQWQMVNIYVNGDIGIDINIDEAEKWSDKLSAQNNFSGAGTLFEKLIDRKDEKNYNPNKAIDVLLKVASNTNANETQKSTAFLYIGKIYAEHKDVQDANKAIEYTFLSAQSNNTNAIDYFWDNVGIFQYLNQSNIDSKKWINILEKNLSNPTSSLKRENYLLIKLQLVLSGLYTLNLNDLVPNKMKSNYWLEEAIKIGNKENLGILGSTYYPLMEKGIVSPDFEKVVQLYEIDIHKYNDDKWNIIKFKLALHNYEGLGTSQDYKKAFELMSSQNYPTNDFFTAVMYYHGKGVKKDVQKAKEICLNIDISKNPNFYKNQYEELNGKRDKLRAEFFPKLNSDVLAFLEFLEKEIGIKYKD